MFQQPKHNRIVFISYTTRDDGELFSRDLEKNIEENTPYIAFRAQTDLKDSDRWSKKIDKYIEDCFVLIVVITVEANESRWVTYEWAYAAGLGKPIVALIRSKKAEMNLHDKIPQEFHINIGKKFIKSVPNQEDWEALYELLDQIYDEVHIPSYISSALEAARSYDRNVRESAIKYLRDTKLKSAEHALIELCENSFHDELLIRASIALAERNQNNSEIISPVVIRGLLRAMQGSSWANEARGLLQAMDSDYSLDSVYKAYIDERIEHHKRSFYEVLLASKNREVILPILHKLKLIRQDSSGTQYDLNVINIMISLEDAEAIEVIKEIFVNGELDKHIGGIQPIINNIPRYPESTHNLLLDLLKSAGKHAREDYQNWSKIYSMILTSIERIGTDTIQSQLENLCLEDNFCDLHGNAESLARKMKRN